MSKVIELEERNQFRMLLHPVRLEMIRMLRLTGRPLTANDAARLLSLSPLAAKGHLEKLAALGLAETRTETDGQGRKRVLYSPADVELRLNLARKDAFQGEREALAAEFADAVFRDTLETARRYSEAEAEENCLFSVGAAHLTRREREELAGLVRDYLSTHRVPTPEAEEEHWEFVLMARRAPGEAEPRR